MEQNSQHLNPGRLKNFVKHVCVIAKKHKDREFARTDMYKQIQKIKKFSSKKKEMDQELKELNNKINLVLEKEAELLGYKQQNTTLSKELVQKVSENQSKIEQIFNSINNLNGRVKNYVDTKSEREKRIDELEKKIKHQAKRKAVSPLRNKLETLEGKYIELKAKGLDVSKIEEKIKELKVRLSL
ncbi:MAG: hypothetical protein U9O94_11035 [Nanoarchaeota archaeon]|nr:hypothetical protein [Nanoarchaeota archaeon]